MVLNKILICFDYFLVGASVIAVGWFGTNLAIHNIKLALELAQ